MSFTNVGRSVSKIPRAKLAMALIDKAFRNELIRNLNEFRESTFICDTTIKAEGKEFPVHRCVLAAASPYFKALFTTGFQENERRAVELKDIKHTTVSEVIQFMYTGEAKANSSNAQDLIMAADYLMIPSLKSKASSLLEEAISTTNCLALEHFASQFNCVSLKKAAVTHTIRNFVDVVKSDDFKSLEFDQVKDLISRDDIIVSKEDEIFEAVILWVKHDISSRESLLPELLRCVRIFSISRYSLREILRTEELLSGSLECTRILTQVLDALLFPDDLEVLMQKPRSCLKSKELVVFLTGGHDNCRDESVPRNDSFGFVVSTEEWIHLPEMPGPRARHAAALCDGNLYVVGGTGANLLYKFNPLRKKWFSKKGNFPSCSHCSFTTHNLDIYLIGGRNVDLHPVPHVWKYNPKSNNWEERSPMPAPRAAHCAVALENDIYVLAGSDEHTCLNTVYCFSPSTDQWEQRPDMVSARRFAAAAAIAEKKIIIIGGYSDMACKSIVTTSEIFDKNMNQWTVVAGPRIPRTACGIASLGKFVYLFGGEDGRQELDSVERFVAEENVWCQLISTMPKRRTCLQATLMLLPSD